MRHIRDPITGRCVVCEKNGGPHVFNPADDLKNYRATWDEARRKIVYVNALSGNKSPPTNFSLKHRGQHVYHHTASPPSSPKSKKKNLGYIDGLDIDGMDSSRGQAVIINDPSGVGGGGYTSRQTITAYGDGDDRTARSTVSTSKITVYPKDNQNTFSINGGGAGGRYNSNETIVYDDPSQFNGNTSNTNIIVSGSAQNARANNQKIVINSPQAQQASSNTILINDGSRQRPPPQNNIVIHDNRAPAPPPSDNIIIHDNRQQAPPPSNTIMVRGGQRQGPQNNVIIHDNRGPAPQQTNTILVNDMRSQAQNPNQTIYLNDQGAGMNSGYNTNTTIVTKGQRLQGGPIQDTIIYDEDSGLGVQDEYDETYRGSNSLGRNQSSTRTTVIRSRSQSPGVKVNSSGYNSQSQQYVNVQGNGYGYNQGAQIQANNGYYSSKVNTTNVYQEGYQNESYYNNNNGSCGGMNRRRCCAILWGLLALALLAGLAVGLYYAITSGMKSSSTINSATSQLTGGYYQNGVYVYPVTLRPQNAYIIYGMDTPCNPYNNNSAGSNNFTYPDCNTLTTRVVLDNNLTTPIPFVLPAGFFGAGATCASYDYKCFILSVIMVFIYRIYH